MKATGPKMTASGSDPEVSVPVRAVRELILAEIRRVRTLRPNTVEAMYRATRVLVVLDRLDRAVVRLSQETVKAGDRR